ncbi:MAG: agmatine deiminase family protein [Helicobacteraceae bacterium]|nr:agmatine deiminase family protein [Helicobacteraceae bacterium]
MKRFIAEFEEQSFTQIIFPHPKSDWCEYLDDAKENFINIIKAIIKYQKCLVVCDNVADVSGYFTPHKNLFFVEYQTNDTWARDCSALSIVENKELKLLDFTFTGWGGKFDASLDNEMSQAIGSYYGTPMQSIDLILEGGGVESNGEGIILTTSECMLNPNRNSHLSEEQMTQKLQELFGAKEILYLHNGYLAGDDTDSHIDTLARFIDANTIMYVKCENSLDEHYEALKAMENELFALQKSHGFELVALPMTAPLFYDEERLPATYANFLFVNGAVIVPTYGVVQDEEALEIFRKTFPKHDIVGVDCSVLVRQHGSLHCVTMNFAKGVELKTPSS